MGRHITCGRGSRYRAAASSTATGRSRSAPRWSPAAASIALLALDSLGLASSRAAQLAACFSSAALLRRWCSLLSAFGSRASSDLAAVIIAHHSATLISCTPSAILRHCDSLRVTLHRRGAKFSRLLPLSLPVVAHRCPSTFASWLDTSPPPALCQRRPPSPSSRTARHLAAWQLSSTSPAVICFERALGRLVLDRRPVLAPLSATISTSLLHRVSLPTALASSADHYLLLSSSPPRYFTTTEYCRAFSIPPSSSHWSCLTATRLLTARLAASAFGRCVHPLSIARVFHALDLSSHLPPGPLRVCSAFSGLGLGELALGLCLPGRSLHSVGASESDPSLRAFLLAALAPLGLSSSSLFSDARHATHAPYADIFISTPPCNAYSPRNHSRSLAALLAALSLFSTSLDYVRLRRPRLVIVENVTDASAVEGITGILMELADYHWVGGPVDTYTHVGLPMHRAGYLSRGLQEPRASRDVREVCSLVRAA